MVFIQHGRSSDGRVFDRPCGHAQWPITHVTYKIEERFNITASVQKLNCVKKYKYYIKTFILNLHKNHLTYSITKSIYKKLVINRVKVFWKQFVPMAKRADCMATRKKQPEYWNRLSMLKTRQKLSSKVKPYSITQGWNTNCSFLLRPLRQTK